MTASDKAKKELDQRKEFKNILCDLANDQNFMRDGGKRSSIYIRLENLYYAPEKEDRFRHYYSDIFSTLSNICNGDIDGSTEIIGQNLSIIKDGYQPKNFDEQGKIKDISNEIKKLYDHVNLEIARLSYCVSVMKNETEISSIQKKVESAEKTLEEIKEKSENIQKEHISILGIFSAVVLAFIGGIVFSTSVFSNIHLASIYRIVLLTLIVGIVVVNIIYALFTFISNLTNKKGRQFSQKQIIFLLLIFAVIICWAFGVVEIRNNHFS